MKKKVIAIIVSSIVFIALGIFVYYHTSYFACKGNVCYPENQVTGKEDNIMENGYRDITAKEIEEKIGNKENFILLDVRTQEEYVEGHIPNSQLLPLQELKEKVEATIPNKKEEIVVYCRSGVRSRQAAQILIDLGYENVYNLGGIIEWTGEIEK